jgi:hypothetical protein
MAMRAVFLSLLSVSVLFTIGDAFAEYLTAVKPIPGYVCMRLKITREQALNKSFTVPVLTQPSPGASQIGSASIVPFIKAPFDPSKAFQQMLTLDGKQGWIETKWLMPYETPERPNAHCTPSIMSDGRPGIG